MKVMFWHLLVELRNVEETSKGGIVLAQSTQEVEMLQTNVGKVVAMGPMCFTTKTSGGHDFATHKDDVTIGSWVLTSKKIGFPIDFGDGKKYQLINDYEILLAGLTEDEALKVKAYL